MRIVAIILFLVSCIQLHPQSADTTGLNDIEARPFYDTLLYNDDEPAFHQRELSWKYVYSGQIDSAIIIASKIIQQADLENKSPEFIVHSYTHMGSILAHFTVSDLPHWYFDQAISLYKKYNFGPSGYLRNLYALAAGRFIAENKSPQKAIDLYNKARELAELLDQPLYEASMLNNIGMVHLNDGVIDSAETYFSIAQDILSNKVVELDELSLSLNSNLAEVAMKRQRYKKALGFYAKNYQLVTQNPDANIRPDYRFVTSNLGMGRAALELNEIKSAQNYLKEAEFGLSQLDYSSRLRLTDEVQSLKQAISYKLGDLEAYKNASQARLATLETVRKIETDAQALVTRKLIDLQIESFDQALLAKQKEIELGEKEKIFARFLLVAVVVFFTLIGGFLILLYKRRSTQLLTERKLKEATLRNQKLEEDKLKLQLQNQAKDLSELSAHAVLLRNFTQEAKERLNKLNGLTSEEQQIELRSLSTLFISQLNNDKTRNLLHKNIQEVNHGFYLALSAISPLSKTEREMCALFRLNLSDEQIAELRGSGINAVQVTRHRIKKKLGLAKEQDLAMYLAEIV